MKRLTALLIALVMLIVPISAASSYYDYTDDLLEDGSPIYYFQELSLRLPAEWNGKVIAEQLDGGVSFYQKSSHEKYAAEGIKTGGFLFQLGASVNQSFTQLPSFKYIGFSEESCMNYYLRLPTDYPAYNEPEIREEYDKMYSQIDYVVENAQFYSSKNSTEGSGSGSVIPSGSTDAGYSMSEPENQNGSVGAAAGSAGADAVAVAEEEAAEGEAAEAAEAPAATTWTPQQIRYSFEHSMLPRYFYDRPENMLSVIYANGLYPLWEVVCKDNGADPYYPKEDYIIHWYTDNENVELVQIELPEPDSANLCDRIYFVLGPSSEQTVYYTVESDEFAPNTNFLCTWAPDRTHSILDMMDVLDKKDSGYEDALKKEVEKIAQLAGIEAALTEDTNAAKGSSGGDSGEGKTSEEKPEEKKEETVDTTNLQLIECPQQGFSTMADKAYTWNYEVGTGISIFTEGEERIPYVIVYQGEDLIVEAYEYIKEQYTPYMQNKYGADLISFEEKESYEIGGKTLPAGLYSYRVQGHVVEQIRIFDSTGDRTVAYTAKYLQGEGEATLKALDTAIRTFKADERKDLNH